MVETAPDKSVYEGISKLNKRLKKLSKNQIVSALHKFGSQQVLPKKMEAAKSAVKRAQRNMINVQPAAVQRRKQKKGSKKVLRRGGTNAKISDIPSSQVARKREHNITKNIDCNVPPAKKHSKDMASKCRPKCKPVKKAEKKK